jgi:hypothetical protein
VGNIFMPTEHAVNLGIIYRVLKEGKLVYGYDDNFQRMLEKVLCLKQWKVKKVTALISNAKNEWIFPFNLAKLYNMSSVRPWNLHISII